MSDLSSFASHALALSLQHWMELGRGQDKLTGTPETIEEAALRITNIFIVRLVAVHNHDHADFVDLATSTVARAVLDDNGGDMTQRITPSLFLQLETYITCMLYGYNNELPFHNYQHAYHVTVTCNKFIESLLLSDNPEKPRRRVFGLGSDPLSLMALIFAALIHDVGHTGVSNGQRAKEEPAFAQKCGDGSIHEHNSLNIAFDELLKEEYVELREAMFLDPSQYERFRQLVFGAVVSTDIASPGRAEAAKVKYFDAFPMAGYDDSEADLTERNRRFSISSNISMPRAHTNQKENRRASGQTVSSVSSDITMDSYSMMKHQNKVSRTTGMALQHAPNHHHRSMATTPNNSNSASGHSKRPRRHSIETVDSHVSEFAADSIRMTRERPDEMRRASMGGVVGGGGGGGGGMQRRLSASHSTDTGLVGMARELRRNSINNKTSLLSQESSGELAEMFGKESVKLAHKRADGAPATRIKRTNRAKRTNSLELLGSGVGFGSDNGQEYDGDSSFTVTPPSSGDELDGVVISGTTKGGGGSPVSPRRSSTGSSPAGVDVDATDRDKLSPPIASKADRENRRMTRRLSNGGAPPANFGSIMEEKPGEYNDTSGHFEMENAVYEQSLGEDDSFPTLSVPDSLKAEVVIELCLRAADVAHWYQSWDTMIHFNRRIYLELCEACKKGRGFDPRAHWFDNQAKIMETYLLPLAEQIHYIGALQKGSGIDLVASLESNNDLWLVRGFDVVESLKAES